MTGEVCLGECSWFSWSGFTTSIDISLSSGGVTLRSRVSISGDLAIMGTGLMIVSCLGDWEARFSWDSAEIVTLGLLRTLVFMFLLANIMLGILGVLNLLKLDSAAFLKAASDDLEKALLGTSVGFENAVLSGWDVFKEFRMLFSEGFSESRNCLEERGLKTVFWAVGDGEGQLLLRLSRTDSSSLTWSEMSWRALLESAKF